MNQPDDSTAPELNPRELLLRALHLPADTSDEVLERVARVALDDHLRAQSSHRTEATRLEGLAAVARAEASRADKRARNLLHLIEGAGL